MEIIGINVSGTQDQLQVWDASKAYYMIGRTKQKTAKLNFAKQVKKLKLRYVAEQHARVEYEEWLKSENNPFRVGA